MKKFVSMVGLLLMVGGFARAQQGEYFTVLSNNTDKQNKYLYVEIMYNKPICEDAQAKFFLTLTHDDIIDTIPMAVDSVLNNVGTYSISADKKSISRPQAAGYRLRFKLPLGVTAAQHPTICLQSYTMAFRCKGCAAGGSDAIFALPESKRAGCPYTGDDLLACYKRTSKAANWEAWIRDPRDCNAYRVVLMPDDKWWFAQNLNLGERKDLVPNANANAGTAPFLGSYWCPGGASAVGTKVPTADTLTTKGNVTATTAGSVACTTFGALYTWNTATALDGRRSNNTTQGICPEGWQLPTTAEFTSLFTAVKTDSVARYLKSTVSCRPHSSKVDTACVTDVKPSWAWRRADVQGKVSSPYALGVDMYGFTAHPAGYRLGDGSSFTAMGYGAYWWANSGGTANYAAIDFKKQTGITGTLSGTPALSVRCTRADN